MRRVARILAIVLFCSALLPAAESAKSLFKKGVQAEARQEYEAAYEYYKQAYQQEPSNLKYRVPFERTRFMAAATMIHRGQQLRAQGKLQEALAEFEKATITDPSNDLASQEIMRTQQMIDKQSGKPASGAPHREGEEDPLRKLLEEAGPPVMLNPISNTPIGALELNDQDSKVIYETLGKLANVNVLFDPDYTSRKLTIKLKDVSLREGLDIVALESRTFWRPVTPNTIFVAQDTQAKRRELEQNVIKTFYLGNVAGPTDLQDIVNAIRTVLEVQRIQQIPSQNAIVIKGTPDQLALAEKMVDDIDKAKAEVIVDVWVAQVRRDKKRDLGIVPPQTAAVALQPPGTTSSSGSTTTTTTTPTLNFNTLQHLNSTSYSVTIAPITATALLNDSDTRILQSPRLRAANGEKATLTIADKIPIATGSFGTPVGVGTAVGAVGVNTQFTYTDVGVILEITPTIHPGGQITLKTSLNISNVTGSSTIGGITQPIISQRKEENVMRLNDGEINLLGGILEQDYTKTINGTPFLGQIPILRYLFSQESKEVISNEIVFLMVPHIVRSQELDALNRRSFDVGTGTGIDLHVASGSNGQRRDGLQSASPAPAQPSSAVAAQSQLAPASTVTPSVAPPPMPAANNPGQPSAPTVNPAAAATLAPAPSAAATGNQLSVHLDPGTVNQTQGGTFAMNVVLAHGQDIATFPIQIAYDPNVLQVVNVSTGDFLGKDGQSVVMSQRDDPAAGQLIINARRPPGIGGVSGDGTVFNLVFKAKAKGAGVVSVAAPGARNSHDQPLTVLGSQASITVN